MGTCGKHSCTWSFGLKISLAALSFRTPNSWTCWIYWPGGTKIQVSHDKKPQMMWINPGQNWGPWHLNKNSSVCPTAVVSKENLENREQNPTPKPWNCGGCISFRTCGQGARNSVVVHLLGARTLLVLCWLCPRWEDFI